LLGNSSIKLRLFILLGSRGFHGFGLWEVKMLWVQVMGVTLVLQCIYSKFTGAVFNLLCCQQVKKHITGAFPQDAWMRIADARCIVKKTAA
jgi:hypothetical protein